MIKNAFYLYIIVTINYSNQIIYMTFIITNLKLYINYHINANKYVYMYYKTSSYDNIFSFIYTFIYTIFIYITF